MPPQSPAGFSSLHFAPSSPLTDNRAGYSPLHMMSRFVPFASTTRCSVGTSRLVAQLAGVGNRLLHVLPPSALRL